MAVQTGSDSYTAFGSSEAVGKVQAMLKSDGTAQVRSKDGGQSGKMNTAFAGDIQVACGACAGVLPGMGSSGLGICAAGTHSGNTTDAQTGEPSLDGRRLSPGEKLVMALSKIIVNALSDSKESETRVLYHYTTKDGMESIIKTGFIWPSLRANNPNDARLGDGQYFTDLVPHMYKNASLSAYLLGVPWLGNRFTNYVAIDMNGLPLVQDSKRRYVFLHPNPTPLSISNRIKGFGENE